MKNVMFYCTMMTTVLLQSCSGTQQMKMSEEIFWVSGVKTECSAGAGKMLCLNVYKGDDLAQAAWTAFYAPIEGFNFKEGTCQKIKVSQKKLDPSKVPADGSSIAYALIEVLETREDQRSQLQGEWELLSIRDKKMMINGPIPTLAFDLKTNQLSGNNNCNNYTGKIVKLTSSLIETGEIATTKKMCRDMQISAEYMAAFNSTKSYKIEGNTLTLYDADNRRVLTYVNTKADYRINDIWVTVRINGNPINRMVKSPQLEVNLEKMTISGNDGCNTYMANIKQITNKKIELEPIASTMKACIHMETATMYSEALNRSTSYTIDQGKLTMYDAELKETLSFLKTD